VGWVIVVGVAALVPALVHGHSLGPFDILARRGLSYRPGVVAHNQFASDQITEMIPWTTLAWTQVHHGQLPLWNPYSVLGMPLVFNWQAAAFGLPALVGYLFPVQLAYTAGVLVTLLVAGTGVYALGKTLRLSVVACALAGTVYELGGSFFSWLGWPIASVMSWAGWLLAAALLILRGDRRVRSVVLFALVVAASVYAGQPDSLILLGSMTALLIVALLAQRTPLFGGSGPLLGPIVDVVIAGIAGVALAAPLLLPGFQLLSRSIRSGRGGALGSQEALPFRQFVNMFAGYDGLFTMAAATIGVIVVVLAVTGVVVRWRRKEVRALVAGVVVFAFLSFVQPADTVMNALPGLHAVRWPRAVICLLFLAALLAGTGMDALVRGESSPRVRRWLAGGFVVGGLAFVGIETVGHPPSIPVELRTGFASGFEGRSVLWGAIGLIVGLAAATTLIVAARRSRLVAGRRAGPFRVELLVGALLLVGESVALVATAAPLWTSSSGFTATAAETTLQKTVGSATVGLGTNAQPCHSGLGVVPEANILLGVHEMAAYDPLLTKNYFKAWRKATGQTGGLPSLSLFCPQVASVDTARQFGIGYVLESHGSPGPKGAVFDRQVGDEDLYRIPGAAAATLTPLGADGALPTADAAGTPVAVTHPIPSVWRVTTSAATEQVLRLHLTDEPGWHATSDGHPLPLLPFSGVMIQARIPPGRHIVTVTYWPTTFSVGLVLAALAVVGLAGGAVVAATRRRRRGSSSVVEGDDEKDDLVTASVGSGEAVAVEPESGAGIDDG